MVLENKEASKANALSWSKPLGTNRAFTLRRGSTAMTNKRSRIKRKFGVVEGARRRRIGRIEGQVRALKKLVTNNHEADGLEGLLRDTADYIVSLETRIRTLKVIVAALSNSH
ncbi:hypothetical protein Droror1_Dr00003798 [Drosera rotundifolia]